jgi:F0F1-type ATP synthase membrane subunit b/b'
MQHNPCKHVIHINKTEKEKAIMGTLLGGIILLSIAGIFVWIILSPFYGRLGKKVNERFTKIKNREGEEDANGGKDNE